MRLELVSLYTFIRISVSSAVALEPHPDPTGLTDCASLPGELYINTVFGHFWKTYFNHTVKDFIDSGFICRLPSGDWKLARASLTTQSYYPSHSSFVRFQFLLVSLGDGPVTLGVYLRDHTRTPLCGGQPVMFVSGCVRSSPWHKMQCV